MRLYVARHGETEWNRLNKVCGRTDSPLTDTGLRQAQLLADKLDDCPIDVIIASPLSRAQKTAQAVAQRKHLQVVTVCMRGFLEMMRISSIIRGCLPIDTQVENP